MMLANLILLTAAAYAAAGLAFAVVFLHRGLTAFDPAARGAPWTFRLAIVPGLVALWPLMLRRWRAGGPPSAGRSAQDLQRRHARTWALLAPLVLAGFAAALAWRPAPALPADTHTTPPPGAHP